MPDTPLVNTTPGILAMLAKARKALGDWAFDQVHQAAIEHNKHDTRDIRAAQIAQAFGQEQMFPKQPLRPTSLTKFQDQPWYSNAPYLPKRIDMGELSNKPLPTTLPYRLTEKEAASVRGDMPLIHGLLDMDTHYYMPLEKQLGLGHGTLSLGKDPATGKPYLSVFDSWDFKPGGPPDDQETGVDEMSRSILDKTVKPFNMYDRVPFDLTKERTFGPVNAIPDTIFPDVRSRDINLPVSMSKAAIEARAREAQLQMLKQPPKKK